MPNSIYTGVKILTLKYKNSHTRYIFNLNDIFLLLIYKFIHKCI